MNPSFETHDWQNDERFQAGLCTVLQNVNEQDREEVEQQAKLFYWKRLNAEQEMSKPGKESTETDDNTESKTKTDTKTDHNTNQLDQPDQPGPAADKPDTSQNEEPRPSRYADIVQLILSGKPVPGIREIPDTLLGADAGSKPVVARRKKPWETE